MAISVFKRYELKFMLNREQYEAVLRGISEYMNPDDYCGGGDCYTIYNIYYDTADYSLIRTSLSKPYYKEKLRMRSYQIPSSPGDQVFLELKKKTGGIVHKRRATMTLAAAQALLETGKGPASKSYLNSQVIRELEYFLSRNKVYPSAYISYDRTAFFGKDDKQFRITFDHDIISRRHDLQLESGCYGSRLLEEGFYLMEIKLSGAMPLWLAGLLSGLGIFRTSFSKYGSVYLNSCCRDRLVRRPVRTPAGLVPAGLTA